MTPTTPWKPTHKTLVRRIAQWLKWTRRMTVVMSELATRNGETPDVIGWIGGASSTLVECKASRADFLADAGKWFRRHEESGMGDLRYVAAPRGMLSPNETPEGWGLLEVDDRCVRTTKEAQPKNGNKRAECVMLMSALRRLELSTAVFVVSDDGNDGNDGNEGDQEPHPRPHGLH